VIAPATLDSLKATALGLTPTPLVALACEAPRKRWPRGVMPCVNAAYATHPQFGRRRRAGAAR
jgi:hypothetical protein